MSTEQFSNEYYAKHSDPQFWQAMGVIDKIMPLKENYHILDIGCLDGKISAEVLAPKVKSGKVIGVDQVNVDYSRQKYSHVKNVEWLTLDIASDPLPYTNYFDIVTCFSCLHWLVDLKTTFTNVYSSLNSGGKFYAVCDGAHPHNYFVQSVKYQISSDKWASYFTGKDIPYHLRDTETFTQEMQNAGLRVLQCEMSEDIDKFSSLDHFYDWIYACCPYKHILGNKHREFWNDTIDTYLQKVPLSDKGEICVHFFSIYIQATK